MEVEQLVAHEDLRERLRDRPTVLRCDHRERGRRGQRLAQLVGRHIVRRVARPEVSDEARDRRGERVAGPRKRVKPLGAGADRDQDLIGGDLIGKRQMFGRANFDLLRLRILA